jgi:hypothetical protein
MYDLIETLEPACTAIKTLMQLAAFIRPNKEQPDPILVIALTLNDEPYVEKFMTDRHEPTLEILLTLKHEPISTWFITLN